ncbi:hypothetical protein AB6E80_09420 [Staphylococcus ureilyticus]|uniref:hypothetical protein n=1 Tax=Staphylococcus ureilyticus TaxID=94138 RepID=UPI0034DCE518
MKQQEEKKGGVLVDLNNNFSYQVILGTALGDGHIRKRSEGSKASIRIGHSIDKSEYLMWILKHLREIAEVTNVGIVKGGKYEKSPNDYVYISSRASDSITEIWELLYKDKKKKISKKLLDNFDDVSFAVFLMDDGSFDKHIDSMCYYLHTNAHTLEENEMFVNFLKDKYGLNPRVRNVKKGEGYCIWFPKKDSMKICEIVKPVISEIQCMRYKLADEYVQK